MSARRRSPIANISRRPVDVDYTHKKQSGGSGQFGRSQGEGEHRASAAAGIIFIDEIKGGNIPEGIYPLDREGHARDGSDRHRSSASRSSTSRSSLIDGAYPRRRLRRRLAFEICARGAMREAAQKAGHHAARADR